MRVEEPDHQVCKTWGSSTLEDRLEMAKRDPRGLLGPISEAMSGTHRMRLGYISKKAGDRHIRREIRPYEVSRASLWATDTIHGADRIHRFKLDRIRSLYTLPGKTYIPRWPVQNPVPAMRSKLTTLQERIKAAREALRQGAEEALPQH